MTESNRRWIVSIVAFAAVVFGVVLLGKPFQSLESMPILLVFVAIALLLWRGSTRHRAVLAAIALVVAGGLLLDRELAVALLVYGAIAYLLVSGARNTAMLREQRWTSGTFGIAVFLLGVIAAFWLDVTSILLGHRSDPYLATYSSPETH
jgi:hypothetical protein